MKIGHREKAYVGMTVWACFTLVLIAFGISLRLRHIWAQSLSPEARNVLIWTTLLVPYISFFWTAYHFTRAKGQSAGLILIGILGPVTQLIAFAIIIYLPDKFAKIRKRKVKVEYNSQVERIIHYRSKAFSRITLGILGVFVAIFLSLFSALWLADSDDQLLTALLVFVVGYASLVSGCSYWATAKGWNDAIVFIALSPLAMFLFPGVKLIFVLLPALISISMVMMALILICVIAILPDKSGISKRKMFDFKKHSNKSSEDRD